VKLDGETKEVFTLEGGYKGKSIIVATGSMAESPPSKERRNSSAGA